MKIKRIYDISRSIRADMAVCPGINGFKLYKHCSMEAGDPFNAGEITMSLHAGTHIDTPLHHLINGVDAASINLFRCIGSAKLFEIDCKKIITSDDLMCLSIEKGDIVLFKTDNSNRHESEPFFFGFTALSVDAAEYLIKKEIIALGIDYFSVERLDSPDSIVHKTLLRQDICIIEGLCLKHVPPGVYFLSCLPLRIEGAEGSPARAVLIEFQ